MAIAKGIQFIAELRKGVQAIDPAMQGTTQVFPTDVPPPSYNFTLGNIDLRDGYYGVIKCINVPAGIYPLASGTESVQVSDTFFVPEPPGLGFSGHALRRANAEVLGQGQVITERGTLNPTSSYVALEQESKSSNVSISITLSARFTFPANSMSASLAEQGHIAFRVVDTEHYITINEATTTDWSPLRAELQDPDTGLPYYSRAVGQGTLSYDAEQPDFSTSTSAINITELQDNSEGGQFTRIVLEPGAHNRLQYTVRGYAVPYSDTGAVRRSLTGMSATLAGVTCWEYQNREEIPLVFDKFSSGTVYMREATLAETSAVVCTIKYRPNTEVIEELINR